MWGPASRRNWLFIAADFPDRIQDFPVPALNRRIPVIIQSQSHSFARSRTSCSISKHRLQDLLVQDQCTHIAGELTPLKEYDALEHIRQLTQLHSRLTEESTHNLKGHYDPDLDQLHITIDSIFDSLPTLIQLPDFSEMSSVLFQ